MNILQLNLEARDVHKSCYNWWHKDGVKIDRNKGELFMLVLSECAEAMEGERKDLMDDHLPLRKMAEVECADIVIRALDLVGSYDWQIEDWMPKNMMTDNRSECLLRISICFTDAYAACLRGDESFAARAVSAGILGCYAYCEKFGYDLDGAIAEKRAYNLVRADHTAAARALPGGKKF